MHFISEFNLTMNCKNTREADVISIEPWWSRTSAQQLCTVVAERIIKYNLVLCFCCCRCWSSPPKMLEHARNRISNIILTSSPASRKMNGFMSTLLDRRTPFSVCSVEFTRMYEQKMSRLVLIYNAHFFFKTGLH